MEIRPDEIGVVITTYNSPDWLEKVLFGYENQTDQAFTVLIADDGSNDETKKLINCFVERGNLKLVHYWHADSGFRKTIILNKVIAGTDCDYLIFTDGDCIPKDDFVAVHREYSSKSTFLSGGYIKLSMPVSQLIGESNIKDRAMFTKEGLLRLGQTSSLKLLKLIKPSWLKFLLNTLTPTKASWNGMNSSGWTDDIKAVNGFDERMQYGGLDRELGERLWNYGIKSKQVRYSAICLHLDHPRGYSNPDSWTFNNQLRQDVKKNKIIWTDFGIKK